VARLKLASRPVIGLSEEEKEKEKEKERKGKLIKKSI